VHVGKSVFSRL